MTIDASAGIPDEILLFGSPASMPASVTTPALISAMLDSGKGISDLIFSPGRPPQVEKQGNLVSVDIPELPMLRPEDTTRIASDLVENNAQAARTLQEQGACDLSFSLPERSR